MVMRSGKSINRKESGGGQRPGYGWDIVLVMAIVLVVGGVKWCRSRPAPPITAVSQADRIGDASGKELEKEPSSEPGQQSGGESGESPFDQSAQGPKEPTRHPSE